MGPTNAIDSMTKVGGSVTERSFSPMASPGSSIAPTQRSLPEKSNNKKPDETIKKGQWKPQQIKIKSIG